MRKNILILTSIAMTALLSNGCASASKALGIAKTTPNEFNIVTKAPLVVPPEYNLRPPKPGEINVEEKYSTVAARQALLGDIDSAEPSPGEAVLMTKAGVLRADPTIRQVIDGQNSIERKSRGFAERVIFWRSGKAYDRDGQPLDPDTEAQRLKAIEAVTGGGKVEIKRRPGGEKLPGL